jgi:hypothetical protein
MTILIDSRIKNAANQSTKQVNRKLTPHAVVAIAVEQFLCDLFEERIRRCQIDECVALIIGYEFSAALDE